MVLSGINKWMNGAPGVVQTTEPAAVTVMLVVHSIHYQLLQVSI